MKILLYFNTEVGRESIFKLIVGSKSLLDIGDDSGVILIFITSGGLIGKVQCFHIVGFISVLEVLLMGRHTQICYILIGKRQRLSILDV
jgi:hypothetical protein